MIREKQKLSTLSMKWVPFFVLCTLFRPCNKRLQLSKRQVKTRLCWQMSAGGSYIYPFFDETLMRISGHQSTEDTSYAILHWIILRTLPKVQNGGMKLQLSEYHKRHFP
ncbi:proline-trna ligase [Moniliophthora roreri]|nr:proline-trna ligase [Moniliophthora roreri]